MRDAMFIAAALMCCLAVCAGCEVRIRVESRPSDPVRVDDNPDLPPNSGLFLPPKG